MADFCFKANLVGISGPTVLVHTVYTCVHEQHWVLEDVYSLVSWFYQSHCVNTQVGIPGNGALPHG